VVTNKNTFYCMLTYFFHCPETKVSFFAFPILLILYSNVEAIFLFFTLVFQTKTTGRLALVYFAQTLAVL
jgi:hypothetical protein